MPKKPGKHEGKHHATHERAEEHHQHKSVGAAVSVGSDNHADDLTESDDTLHAGPDQAGGDELHAVSGPQFAQPDITPDPTKFQTPHPSDDPAYKILDHEKLKPMAFPLPRGGTEPVLKLADIWGSKGSDVEQHINKSGQIVFHAVGDTGNTKGPATEDEVADKMVSDFDEQNATDIPVFFFHLGDVVYSFGEAAYYYDQFYDVYRNYPAPIIALAGNHDGMVAPNTDVPTLQAFLENFCQTEFVVTPEAGGLSRTAQIQPGIFFTFEAPFVRVFVFTATRSKTLASSVPRMANFPKCQTISLTTCGPRSPALRPSITRAR